MLGGGLRAQESPSPGRGRGDRGASLEGVCAFAQGKSHKIKVNTARTLGSPPLALRAASSYTPIPKGLLPPLGPRSSFLLAFRWSRDGCGARCPAPLPSYSLFRGCGPVAVLPSLPDLVDSADGDPVPDSPPGEGGSIRSSRRTSPGPREVGPAVSVVDSRSHPRSLYRTRLAHPFRRLLIELGEAWSSLSWFMIVRLLSVVATGLPPRRAPYAPAPGGPESCWLPLNSQHSAEQGLQKTARW